MNENKIKLIMLDNGMQLMATVNPSNRVYDPFQLIQKPTGPEGKMGITIQPLAPFGDVGSAVLFNMDSIVMSYEITDKGMIDNYNASVKNLRERKSGIVTPDKKLDLKL